LLLSEEFVEGDGAVVVVEEVEARVDGVEFYAFFAGVLVEDAVGIGGVVGRGEAGLAGQSEECEGGAERCGLIGGADLAAEDADGVAEEATELVGGGAPDFLTAAIELGLEDVVVEPPAVDGGASDIEVASDGGVGLAHDEEFDGVLLGGGQRDELGFEGGEVAAGGGRMRGLGDGEMGGGGIGATRRRRIADWSVTGCNIL
jgi:hypothetical protein